MRASRSDTHASIWGKHTLDDGTAVRKAIHCGIDTCFDVGTAFSKVNPLATVYGTRDSESNTSQHTRLTRSSRLSNGMRTCLNEMVDVDTPVQHVM